MVNPGHSSHLTDAKYGYDFVVATTQAAINSTMLAYLNGLNVSPTVAVYVANKEGKPVSTDYAALVKTAGCDPFKVDPTVQGFDVTTNKDVQALVRARFMFGFVSPSAQSHAEAQQRTQAITDNNLVEPHSWHSPRL